MFLIPIKGTKVIPADFIAAVDTHNPVSAGVHHEVSILTPEE